VKPVVMQSDRRIVMMSPVLYAVCLDGVPVSIRSTDRYLYRQTVFASRAHAERLAKRLNTEFGNTRFSVQPLAAYSAAGA
jgi:hypothetical protein